MKRRRNAQPELRPVYVRPNLDSRERAAQRDFCRAAYRGERHRPKPGDFDPLWFRLGLRMSQIDSRAGWVVSNPLFDQQLRRQPLTDPSLPGPGWLREVYRWRYFDLVTLPGVRREIGRRLNALRVAEAREALPMRPQVEQCNVAPQQLLFSAEESS